MKVFNFMHLLPLVAITLVVTGACKRSSQNSDSTTDYATDTLVTAHPLSSTPGEVDFHPEGEIHHLPVHIVPGRLRDIFCDTNGLQLTAARANGIEPITDLRSSWHTKRPLQRVYSCDEYMIDSLSMSMPYLVPRAAQLLKDIGRAFQDTVKARGGKDYRIRVTSLLRTDYSVARLRRRNRSATDQSCHRYGTTFDISWVKFDCRDTTFLVSLEDLKNILAEIVYDERQHGRCYAIFERRQGCFHITVR
ncbi:MAG: hypothetical protein IJ808_08960 [Muribaculaceae bacterium]|nr:hypothetical protein [Muribaculaceae bacterium]